MSRAVPLVLIVDDLPENLRVLASILREENLAFAFAQGGEEALAAFPECRPDLVLLDVTMPGLDGFETCRRLKSDPASAGAPVIFLTARVEPEDLLRGFGAGGVDYVTKPFRARELVSRVRTHLDLRFAREALAETLADREALAHILCHDLANPLGVVKGAMELLAEDPSLLPRFQRPLAAAGEQGLAIIDLVRRLLAVEGGKVDLEPVEISGAVEELRLLLGPRLERKGVRLENLAPPGLRALADRAALVNTVLGNLVTNAIKFSTAGSAITVSAAREGATVRCACADHGVGMPRRILDRLFDLREKTSRPGTDGEKGTGFGLPLVKRLAEAMGGSVSVESREREAGAGEGGTTVTLLLRAAD